MALVGLAVLVAFGVALYRDRMTLSSMSRLGTSVVVAMTLTVVMHLFVSGCTTRIYLRGLGISLPVSEAFWLACVNSLCGYLPLQLNLLIRAKYLKQLHELDYVSYTAMIVVNLMIMFCSIGIYGILSLMLISWWTGQINISLCVLFLICFIGPSVVVAVGTMIVPGRTFRSERLSRIIRAASALCKPAIVWRAMALTIVSLFILSARFYLASSNAPNESRVELAAMLSPLSTLTTYAAITPSGLGLRELVAGGMSQVIGIDHATGLAVATIERAVSLAVYAVLGGVGMAVLAARFRLNSTTAS